MGLSDAIKASVALAQQHTEAKKRAATEKFDTATGERTRWGERIGNEGLNTHDFIDSDRDRVDDRYQVGPGGEEDKRAAKARDEAYILPWEREGWGSGDYDRIGLTITETPKEKINRETRRPALRTGVFHPTTGLQRDYIFMPSEKEQRRERAYEELGAPELRRERIHDPAVERPKTYGRWQDTELTGYTPVSRPVSRPVEPKAYDRWQNTELTGYTPSRQTVIRPDDEHGPNAPYGFPSKRRKPNIKSPGNQGPPPPPPQAPRWDERPAYIAPWDRDDWGRGDRQSNPMWQ